MIRVTLPYHLRNLAKVKGEVQVEIEGPATIQKILDALEAQYPALSGTIRMHDTHKRRPLIRYYACEQDFSHLDPHEELPEAITLGKSPFEVIGSIAGG